MRLQFEMRKCHMAFVAQLDAKAGTLLGASRLLGSLSIVNKEIGKKSLIFAVAFLF